MQINIKIVFVVIFVLILSSFADIKITNKSNYLPEKFFSKRYKTKKGEYTTILNFNRPKTVEFAKNFLGAEIGGFSDIKDIYKEIKNIGIPFKIAYVWLPAFYHFEIKYDQFAKKIYFQKTIKTLNPPNFDTNIYFYDLCNEDVRTERADFIISQLKLLNLEGVFCDWANENFLYEKRFEPILQEYKSRYNKNYSECIKEFLKILKEKNILILTNRAYKNQELLEYVDFDITESYISTDKYIKTDKNILIDNSFEDLLPITYFTPLDKVLDTASKLKTLKNRYKNIKNYIYINYLSPKITPVADNNYTLTKPKDEIYYVYALTRLIDFIPYIEIPSNREFEIDDIYFADIGMPLGDYIKNENYYYRYFQNGFIIVADKIVQEKYIKIDNLKNGYLYDIKDDVWLKVDENKTVIKLEPNFDIIQQKYLPVGKIFIYEYNEQ